MRQIIKQSDLGIERREFSESDFFVSVISRDPPVPGRETIYQFPTALIHVTRACMIGP